METNQGTYEAMVRPITQVGDMTLEDTVMLGAIKKEVNGSHYSLQRDDDGNHLPNTPFLSTVRGLKNIEDISDNIGGSSHHLINTVITATIIITTIVLLIDAIIIMIIIIIVMFILILILIHILILIRINIVSSCCRFVFYKLMVFD